MPYVKMMLRGIVASLLRPRALAPVGLFAALFLLAGVAPLYAQETPQEVAAFNAVTIWKIINFSIFAAVIGYAVMKYAPRFFNARSADIQKAIKDATGLKLEADYRYSEIDRKMATLADEVRRLREQAKRDLDREHERFRREAQLEIDHINRNVANEIDAFTREAVSEVRRHTAQLALGLAERRLQDRFKDGEPEELIHDFVNLVERGKN